LTEEKEGRYRQDALKHFFENDSAQQTIMAMKFPNLKFSLPPKNLEYLVTRTLFLLLGLWLIVISADIGFSQKADPINPSQTRGVFDPAETQHGFSEFDTAPPDPSEQSASPLPYYKDLMPSNQLRLDQKPEGLFLNITLSEDIDEDLEIRHGHVYHPVHPTDEFTIDTPAIYVVFRVFKHYQAYQVIGQVVPDAVDDTTTVEIIDEDIAYLALEDESGYLKFFPPSEEGWKTGPYRIDIYVGYEANAVSKMGTLRFRVIQNSQDSGGP